MRLIPFPRYSQTCGRISRTDDVMLILNYLAFGGTFTCYFTLGSSTDDCSEAFTSLRVYGVWGRDWKPLLAVVPLTLIKPALIIVRNFF